MAEAECSISSLVEWLNKRDIQSGHVTPQTKVDICLCPMVAGLEGKGATLKRPQGTVGVGDGLVDTTARIFPIQWQWISGGCDGRKVVLCTIESKRNLLANTGIGR